MIHSRFPARLLPVFLIAAGISACSSGTVRDTLGMSRKAPDEYKVVSRPPLSVPPDFNLRPPAVGEDPIATMPASKEAKNMLIGSDGAPLDTAAPQAGGQKPLAEGHADTAVQPVTANNLGSAAETKFLANAGADNANPEIRVTLHNETGDLSSQDQSTWDQLTTLPTKKEPIVKAPDEAERLKKNQEEGKPVTEGETPTVKPKSTGILGSLFGY